MMGIERGLLPGDAFLRCEYDCPNDDLQWGVTREHLLRFTTLDGQRRMLCLWHTAQDEDQSEDRRTWFVPGDIVVRIQGMDGMLQIVTVRNILSDTMHNIILKISYEVDADAPQLLREQQLYDIEKPITEDAIKEKMHSLLRELRGENCTESRKAGLRFKEEKMSIWTWLLNTLTSWGWRARKEKWILFFLLNGEQTGRELVQASGGRLHRGTIYVLLLGMEERGLVETDNHDGRYPLWKYRITEQGRNQISGLGKELP